MKKKKKVSHVAAESWGEGTNQKVDWSFDTKKIVCARISKKFQPGSACAYCEGWSGLKHFAEVLNSLFTEHGSNFNVIKVI